MKQRSIWVGFDPREAAAFAVCRHSIRKHLTRHIEISGVVLDELTRCGLYYRQWEWRKVPPALGHVMWDVISGAPMSTQHANARFLVPHLAQKGWALFCDGDLLFREDVSQLFTTLDDDKAIYCVKHDHKPASEIKMDGQVQTTYHRKNWSSFMIFNCDHPANKPLTVEMINTLPGRDLHRLCWIEDENLIGGLDQSWNFLVGVTPAVERVRAAHFTNGVPDMRGFENIAFADEWRQELIEWAL